MPEVKWTDDAIERELRLCPKDADVWRSALLELKRVRAWAWIGYNMDNVAVGYHGILNGEPAPGGGEKQ